jgi:hypothetical protein
MSQQYVAEMVPEKEQTVQQDARRPLLSISGRMTRGPAGEPRRDSAAGMTAPSATSVVAERDSPHLVFDPIEEWRQAKSGCRLRCGR